MNIPTAEIARISWRWFLSLRRGASLFATLPSAPLHHNAVVWDITQLMHAVSFLSPTLSFFEHSYTPIMASL